MTMVSPDDGRPSISRTARYKKVTKPLLERKRRARINRCLDELKDLMVGAFEVEGDNISKLEKADILELTVQHLTKLHSPRDPAADAKRFQAGFGQCAAEACQFILSMPEIDSQISQNLINHLRSQIGDVPLNIQSPSKPQFSPQISPDARSIWSAPGNMEYGKFSSQPNMNGVSSPTLDYRPVQSSGYKRPDVPHVPVNQSLVCDTSSNCMPRIHDMSRPMTGLLMTVNNNSRDNQNEFIAKEMHPDNRVEYEMKKKHNSEMKNVLRQKIREQILSRQVKEADLRTDEHNNAVALHMQNQYHHHTNMKSHTLGQEQIQNASMDLRKKSKGEAKHYSPRLDIHHKNYTDMNVKREEVHFSPEAINYSTNRDHVPMIINENVNHGEATVMIRKKTPDYRSVHPKKVFMQPSYSNQNVENDNMKNHQKEMSLIESGEKRSHSELRHHRFSIPNRQEVYLYEQYSSSTSSNVDPHYYQRPKNEYGESLNLKHDANSKRARFETHNQANNDNEQEDNMWRPW